MGDKSESEAESSAEPRHASRESVPDSLRASRAALASRQGPEMGLAPSSSTPEERLLSLRSSIDNIDAALVHMLAERFRCTQEVGRLKAEHEMPASDPQREARQIARLRALAADAQLDPEFAEKWFNFVVAEVIHHHHRLANEAAADEG